MIPKSVGDTLSLEVFADEQVEQVRAATYRDDARHLIPRDRNIIVELCRCDFPLNARGCERHQEGIGFRAIGVDQKVMCERTNQGTDGRRVFGVGWADKHEVIIRSQLIAMNKVGRGVAPIPAPSQSRQMKLVGHAVRIGLLLTSKIMTSISFIEANGAGMASRIVRRATAQDVTVLTNIRNDAHRKKVSCCDYVWGKEGDGFSEKWVLDHLSQREVYIVEEEGLAVATLTLDMGSDAHWEGHDQAAGYVHGLCVRSGFNGRGLGRFMLEWSADKIRDNNCLYIRLDCALQNTNLCIYYESLGFVRVGIKTGSVDWSLYEKSTS